MEQVMIAALLEKYWLAETTVEEERQLAEYFRQPVIPAQWEPWRNVFAYFETEAQITPGEDFEARLLERIRQAEATAPGPSNSDLRAAPVRPLFRRAPWWAAAAVIILALGISRLAESPGAATTPNDSVAQSGAANAGTTTSGEATAIKDTYDDPQQALAAIRRALGTASAKMNHGRNITQKQIDRMNDGLQSAIAN
ncbi:MAG TPA: hypothetical protein VNS58_27935 [Puia sp.]|nr:hypothetical protein [Puia sp.]